AAYPLNEVTGAVESIAVAPVPVTAQNPGGFVVYAGLQLFVRRLSLVCVGTISGNRTPPRTSFEDKRIQRLRASQPLRAMRRGWPVSGGVARQNVGGRQPPPGQKGAADEEGGPLIPRMGGRDGGGRKAEPPVDGKPLRGRPPALPAEQGT